MSFQTSQNYMNFRNTHKIISDYEQMEIIIKYHGDLSHVANTLNAQIELLGCNYAILTVKTISIDNLYDFPEIDYVELPKDTTFLLRSELDSTCFYSSIKASNQYLAGNGVLVGIIDSGIDYTHLDFRNNDGTTRILSIWDQTTPGTPPKGFLHGTEYRQAQINDILQSFVSQTTLPSTDTIGHGTAVAGIIAGNGISSKGVEVGIAPESTLIIVKLGNRGNVNFSRTTEIMRGIKYLSDIALEYNRPLVINLSYGTNNGSHDGTSLFERYIDSMCDVGKTVIVVAAGNEGDTSHHARIKLQTNKTQIINFKHTCHGNRAYISLWKNFLDSIVITVIAPSGRMSSPILPSHSTSVHILDDIRVSVYYRQPTPYTKTQEIYFDLQPLYQNDLSGIWQLSITGLAIVDGEINLWLPTYEDVFDNTFFLEPDINSTCTIPATSKRVISVGAYDSVTNSYASFSGRGGVFPHDNPDLLAPGVNVLSTKAGGGYDSFTGTSVAAPFVTGAAALLMEWGIIKGNDKFLYGQRVKAFLCKNALRKSNTIYPNNVEGYGLLQFCSTISDLAEYTKYGGIF